jgi:hypothetical protein
VAEGERIPGMFTFVICPGASSAPNAASRRRSYFPVLARDPVPDGRGLPTRATVTLQSIGAGPPRPR